MEICTKLAAVLAALNHPIPVIVRGVNLLKDRQTLLEAKLHQSPIRKNIFVGQLSLTKIEDLKKLIKGKKVKIENEAAVPKSPHWPEPKK
jgi:glycerol dehydrogenase-like iron-containing ADH family enzyme